MAAKKTTRNTGRPGTTGTTTGATSKPGGTQAERTLPPEEYVKVWTNFAKELGETTSDFVKRFGGEQQKNYEQWASTLRGQGTLKPTPEDFQEVTSRFQDWNDMAQEIGKKVADAFTAGTDLQKEFFSAWSAAKPAGSQDPAESVKEFTELAQKFWTGIAGNLYQKSLTSFAPQVPFDSFTKSQEESLREMTENFKKLTYTYFTSPPFVTLFGKTLDSTLEAQKQLQEKGGPLAYLTSFPTKKDLAQLQETLVEISNKVDRLEEKIRR